MFVCLFVCLFVCVCGTIGSPWGTLKKQKQIQAPPPRRVGKDGLIAFRNKGALFHSRRPFCGFCRSWAICGTYEAIVGQLWFQHRRKSADAFQVVKKAAAVQDNLQKKVAK